MMKEWITSWESGVLNDDMVELSPVVGYGGFDAS